ncbi:unnamed protein product [Rodentolepis nana]|uniref:WD repeat-containing protein 37 n=1 Tax=Rodentolepis nana TaxID=102285 RepID=A0A0R3T4E8_RODNA|nr:unnamed protein product [Rodentolepis nana]
MTSIGTGVTSVCAASQTDGEWPAALPPDLSESTLPREFRSRLHKMFERVEREFEREYQKLCAENFTLQEKLEKFEDTDHPESSIFTKKLTASQLSHRIKQQYKQSTSRLVSSLRPTSGGLTLPGPGQMSSSNANDLSSRANSWNFIHRFSGHRDGIWEVTCFRSFIASASADTTVRLWSNSDQHNCLLIYSGHSGSVNSVRFRDRDNLMLTGSGDGTAHLIALPPSFFSDGQYATSNACQGASGDFENSQLTEGGNVQHQIQLRDPSAVFQSASLGDTGVTGGSSSSLDSYPLAAADFVCGREQLVTASWDRLGHLYDLNTGQEVQSLAGHDHELTDVRCCLRLPVVVTSARDSTFRVWDFRQPRLEVHVQQAHSRSSYLEIPNSRTVSTAQFLPGSNPHQIVSAGTDRYCRLWDLRNLRVPLFTVRTDAGINRLAISGSSLFQSNNSTTSGFGESGNTASAAMTALGAAVNASMGISGTSGSTIAPGVSPQNTAGGTDNTSMMSCVLALPLDNRTLRLISSNGSRIGRIPRNVSHGHTSAITSAAWAEEGQCNLFTTGFDQQLLGWHLQIS